MPDPADTKASPAVSTDDRLRILSEQVEELARKVQELSDRPPAWLRRRDFWRTMENATFEHGILSSLAVPREVNVVLSHPKTGGNSLYHAAAQARARVGCTLHAHYTSPPAAGHGAGVLAEQLPGQLRAAGPEDLARLYWHSEHNGSLAEFVRHWFRSHVPLPLAVPLPESQFDRLRRADLPRTNVIIAVREPISCCLSGYFQVMASTRPRAVPPEEVVSDLRNLFALARPSNQAMWWEDQVHRFFGIDFLDLPFDRERGWQVHHFDRVSFLLVKQECFDRVPEAMARLFDMPSAMVSIGRENAAADKGELAELYAAARRGVRFGERDFDQVYDRRWFRRFYGAEEEQAFRSFWSGQRVPEAPA